MKKSSSLPIDAVITWVDSSDKNWQKKINSYSERTINWHDKKESTRYNSINEIEITIKSIIKYAPFIRNIFLVTDAQQPNCFISCQQYASENNMNLELIDHKIIFKNYEFLLPTFNSCSIITMLYKIPKLSENFVVFNDDTFLMRETVEGDFFREGLPVIRGNWDSFYEDKFFRNLYFKINLFFNKEYSKKTSYKQAQQNSAKLLNFTSYIRRDHTPVSIRKSTLENYFKSNPAFLENNIKHRFRHHSQFIISSFSNHLEVKTGIYVLEKNLQLSYFQSYRFLPTMFKLYVFNINKSKKFICFQSLELAPKKSLKFIVKWIDSRLDSDFSKSII